MHLAAHESCSKLGGSENQLSSQVKEHEVVFPGACSFFIIIKLINSNKIYDNYLCSLLSNNSVETEGPAVMSPSSQSVIMYNLAPAETDQSSVSVEYRSSSLLLTVHYM